MKRSLLIFAAFLFLFGADTKAGLPEGHNRRPNGGGGGGGGASYALKFNGSTSYVSIPYSSTLDMSTSFTIEFWVDIQDLTQTGKYIIARNGVNPSQQFGVLYGSVADSVEFYVGNGVGGDNPRPGSQIPISSVGWHHVAYSYDGTNFKGYLDGALILSNVKYFSMSTAENNIQIGGVCDAGNSFVTSNAFSGVVDEVRFWDVARTQAEIQSTMHTILTGTESGLAGYWQFNEGSGTVAHDLTANHNDGTLVNFTLNGTTDGWVPPFDQALKFGPGMYCSRGPFTTLTEPLTLECWVKWSGTTSSPTGECVVYNGNSGLNGYGLYMDNSGYLNALRGGYALGKTSYIPPIGTWVHLALVLSSDVWSLYANGVSQTLDDNTTGASTPAGVFLVGGNIYSTDLTLDYFNGDIDEVRISDVARYTGNFTPPSLPFTTDGNTIALYHFDEGSSATTAYDASGIGNDLTITGSPTNEVSLPVQAADFAAKSDIGSVTLSWKTQSEVDNAGFNIFREDPNTTFYKLVASYTNDVDLRGMGTSTTGQAYQFTDNKVTSGATYQYKIQSVSTNGTTKDLTTLSVTVDIPKNYALYQNYPNPFNPSTMIRFDLKQTSAVTLEIYNVLGQRVEYWNYGMTDAGRYNENVNLDTFASGVYFYRIDAVGGDGQRFESIKKLLLMK